MRPERCSIFLPMQKGGGTGRKKGKNWDKQSLNNGDFISGDEFNLGRNRAAGWMDGGTEDRRRSLGDKEKGKK